MQLPPAPCLVAGLLSGGRTGLWLDWPVAGLAYGWIGLWLACLWLACLSVSGLAAMSTQNSWSEQQELRLDNQCLEHGLAAGNLLGREE